MKMLPNYRVLSAQVALPGRKWAAAMEGYALKITWYMEEIVPLPDVLVLFKSVSHLQNASQTNQSVETEFVKAGKISKTVRRTAINQFAGTVKQ